MERMGETHEREYLGSGDANKRAKKMQRRARKNARLCGGLQARTRCTPGGSGIARWGVPGAAVACMSAAVGGKPRGWPGGAIRGI